MENKRNLLVTLADKNYIQQAKQLFSSVYWNAGWKGDYMLLAHEIPEKDLKWFRDKGILVKKCKPLYNETFGDRNDPPAILDKFYIFSPEFKKWKKVIFLDSDIIARASLDNILEKDSFNAAVDCQQKLKYHFANKPQLKELKRRFNLNKPAFNTGVLVFSTNIIKSDSLDNIMSLFKKYKSLSMTGDQPILNLYFYRRWNKLLPPYNILINYINNTKTPDKYGKGVLIHFARRPGFSGLESVNHPFYREWRDNLDKAEKINLNIIPKGQILNNAKILEISFISYIRYFRYFRYLFLSRGFSRFSESLIRIIKDLLLTRGKNGTKKS